MNPEISHRGAVMASFVQEQLDEITNITAQQGNSQDNLHQNFETQCLHQDDNLDIVITTGLSKVIKQL